MGVMATYGFTADSLQTLLFKNKNRNPKPKQTKNTTTKPVKVHSGKDMLHYISLKSAV